MVDYPDLSSLTNSSGINGLLSLPNASFTWFWTTILAGIFIVLSFTMYHGEKRFSGRGNLLSSMGVASLACIILSTLGSLVGMFTVETLVPIIVFGLTIITIWIFSAKR